MTKMAPYLHVHLALMHAETNPVKNISLIFVSSLRFDSSFIKWADGRSLFHENFPFAAVQVHCRSGAPVSLRPIEEFPFILWIVGRSRSSCAIDDATWLSLDSTFSPEMLQQALVIRCPLQMTVNRLGFETRDFERRIQRSLCPKI